MLASANADAPLGTSLVPPSSRFKATFLPLYTVQSLPFADFFCHFADFNFPFS
jgi:hypothetical protein